LRMIGGRQQNRGKAPGRNATRMSMRPRSNRST
jgi:hypothetical protein